MAHEKEYETADADEVLLQPTTNGAAPRLRCSNCHFERQYTYWYAKLGYKARIVNYCPRCGFHIAGVIGTEVSK